MASCRENHLGKIQPSLKGPYGEAVCFVEKMKKFLGPQTVHSFANFVNYDMSAGLCCLLRASYGLRG